MLRNENFDTLRGGLILCVILGHTLIGSLDANTIRGGIYFFHMPLFLAVTGYFINNKTLSLSMKKLAKKYWQRMVFPYLVAFLIYSAAVFLVSIQGGGWMLTINRGQLPEIIAYILYPYYHLWFIPATVLFIFYTRCIYKKKYLISFFLVFSAVLTSLYNSDFDIFKNNSLVALAGDKRYYCYYYYFLLGYIVAGSYNRRVFMASLLSLPLISAFYVPGFTWPGKRDC